MLKYERANLVLPIGSASESVIVNLPPGNVKRAVIFPVGDPSKEVEISIDDTGRRTIVPGTNFRDWKDGQGEYMARKKPMDFEGGRKIYVFATSEEEQTAAFEFQILFIIEQEEKKVA